MDELKEMQSQLAFLKQALNESRITNRRLLKKVISQKVSSLNRIVWWECVTFPIAVLLLTSFCLATGAGLWLIWIVIVAGVIDIICDFRTIRVPPREIATLPLVDIRKKLLRQKRERKIQNIIMTPFSIVWMICFFIEAMKPFELPEKAKIIVWILLCMVVIGTIAVVLRIIRKTDRTTDILISDIEAGEEEEDLK